MITDIFISEGQVVDRGTPLLQLDDPKIRAAIDSIESQLRQAEWSLQERIAEVLPLTHFMRIVRGIMLRGQSLNTMGDDILFLLAFAGCFMVVSTLRFSKRLAQDGKTVMKKIKRKSKIEEICCRKQSQLLMALLLPVVVVGGYYYPMLGFIVLALITVFMIIASQRGRFYCGWLCPMGAFHERFLTWVSLKKELLPVFKSNWFRWLLFVVMMGLMFSRLYMAWGDAEAVAAVFRFMWIVSTALAIGLGLYFKPRTWCAVCPMGSFQGMSSKNTYILTVDTNCIQCKKCRRVCPISTYPGQYKQESGRGSVPSIDCLRCSNCIVNCPKDALYFSS